MEVAPSNSRRESFSQGENTASLRFFHEAPTTIASSHRDDRVKGQSESASGSSVGRLQAKLMSPATTSTVRQADRRSTPATVHDNKVGVGFAPRPSRPIAILARPSTASGTSDVGSTSSPSGLPADAQLTGVAPPFTSGWSLSQSPALFSAAALLRGSMSQADGWSKAARSGNLGNRWPHSLVDDKELNSGSQDGRATSSPWRPAQTIAMGSPSSRRHDQSTLSSKNPSLLKPRPASAASLDLDLHGSMCWSIDGNRAQDESDVTKNPLDAIEVKRTYRTTEPAFVSPSVALNGGEERRSLRGQTDSQITRPYELAQKRPDHRHESDASAGALLRQLAVRSSMNAEVDAHSRRACQPANSTLRGLEETPTTPPVDAKELGAHAEALLLQKSDEQRQRPKQEQKAHEARFVLVRISSEHDDQDAQEMCDTRLLLSMAPRVVLPIQRKEKHGGVHCTPMRATSTRGPHLATALRHRSHRSEVRSRQDESTTSTQSGDASTPLQRQIRADGQRVDAFLAGESSGWRETAGETVHGTMRVHLGFVLHINVSTPWIPATEDGWTVRAQKIFAGRDWILSFAVPRRGTWLRGALGLIGLSA